MQGPNNGVPVNAVAVAAQLIQFVPYVGPAAAAALTAVGAIYQSHSDCQTISGELPGHLSHFMEKVRRVRTSVESNPQSEGDGWLVTYLADFEKLIQRVQTDLESYRDAKVKWLVGPKFKAKFSTHAKEMKSINKKLNDAMRTMTFSSVRIVVNGMASFTAPAGQQQVAVPPATSTRLVTDVMEWTDTLMLEVDVNGDGYITVDELWAVQQLRDLVMDKTALKRLITNVFDRNGDGRLDYKETVTLLAALHQLSALFEKIPQRCQDRNYISAATAVGALQQAGYTAVTEDDLLDVADRQSMNFRWCVETGRPQVSHDGFVGFYLHAVDRHNLWHHLRARIGMA